MRSECWSSIPARTVSKHAQNSVIDLERVSFDFGSSLFEYVVPGQSQLPGRGVWIY